MADYLYQIIENAVLLMIASFLNKKNLTYKDQKLHQLAFVYALGEPGNTGGDLFLVATSK
jgi:hypothetical protein